MHQWLFPNIVNCVIFDMIFFLFLSTFSRFSSFAQKLKSWMDTGRKVLFAVNCTKTNTILIVIVKFIRIFYKLQTAIFVPIKLNSENYSFFFIPKLQ